MMVNGWGISNGKTDSEDEGPPPLVSAESEEGRSDDGQISQQDGE
jgi:hypothetical protein